MRQSQSGATGDLLPLTAPVFHILLSLTDGPRHGYGIMHDVSDQTNGGLSLGPGTLYGCLKRMTDSGLVVESDGPDESGADDRRRFYRMTALGRRVLRAESERLAAAVAAARSRGVLAYEGARG